MTLYSLKFPHERSDEFGRKEKLSPRYIGPFEILERIGPVAYHLALPFELDGVHPIFHVSMLRKYLLDPSHVIKFHELSLEKDLTYGEKLVAILDRQVKKHRSKNIMLVKMLWQNHAHEETMWEVEEDMHFKHPHLFKA